MYSFDIFDTLITRTTGTPVGIFTLMKDTLYKDRKLHCLEDYVIDSFFELRINSEVLSRKAKEMRKIEEITIYDIYEAMSLCGCIDDRQRSYLIDLEQKTEIENVVPIRENIDRLKDLLKQGEKVVLISDMYLPKDTIRKMLIQADEVFEDIPIYVSSEYLKRKTTGNIYRKVQEIEKIEYSDWTHIGDNMHQDIDVPYRLGIHVEYFKKGELTDFEKDVLNKYESDSSLQLMIGTALKENKNENISYHIGHRYGGPVLYSYAEWIVDQSCKKNINRLYFIARDGYLIKKIVDVILKKKHLNISTKYIYGSRKAWRMASLSEDNYNVYQLILWSHVNRIRTLKNLANVLQIPLEELYVYLPGTYALNKNDVNISRQELEYIAYTLSESKGFKSYHLQTLKQRRELAQRYLSQEVDVSDDSFAFVDVSGGGLTQGCLKELMKDMYKQPIHTFFFKIDRVNLIQDSITDTFIPSFLENNLTIEMMCRAPHGQTRGYMEYEGKIVPDLEAVESKALVEHGYYDYERGILDFSQKMCETSSKIYSVKNVLLYLKNIAHEPSKEVLEYFAAMPSSESGRGDEIVEYAPKLSRDDIEKIFLGRTNEPLEYFYKGTDLNYSLLRASKEELEFVEQCKKEHGSIRGKLYRQDSDRRCNELRSKYGRAAFYPVRLLNKEIILYGAGKFGQDLYHRLSADGEHEIVLWVDKNAEQCKKAGLDNVCDLSEINRFTQLPIVIAVMKKEIADEIMAELINNGIEKQRIIWIPVYNYPNPGGMWKSENIG